MLALHAENLIKYYGDRLILDIPEFKIYTGDRIGLIGTNGCGKTTLLDILTGKTEPDEGSVTMNTTWGYITQLDALDQEQALSGGEITKEKVFDAVSGSPGLLIADEPTANLDSDAIEKIENIFIRLGGSILIVSHDRSFLDKTCNKIAKLQNGKLRFYQGNYSSYEKQAELERLTKINEYDKYLSEKKHLENAVSGMARAEGKIKKTPSRMGNSEARLHKRSSTEIKKHLAQHRKGLQSRLDRLAEKDKPKEIRALRIYHQGVRLPVSRTAVLIDRAVLKAGDKTLVNDIKLNIATGSKIALNGPNGSGKTTLLKLIVNGGSGVAVAPGSRLAYFSQKLDTLIDDKTLIDNILDDSTLDRTIVRTVLASMLFSKTDIHKKTSVLSGGERVKLQLAKVLLSGADLLILDESTNYLDIRAIDALEKLMNEFPGTILYVSHDRRLVENTADRMYEIRNGEIIDATYELQTSKKIRTDLVLIEMRMSELSSFMTRGDVSEEKMSWYTDEFNRLANEKRKIEEDDII